MIELLPIGLDSNENLNFLEDPSLDELVRKIVSSYKLDQRNNPWLGYFAEIDGNIVGCCGFKSNPNPENRVEIAYQTFTPYEGRGFATQMCTALLRIAREELEQVEFFALTLLDNLASERVLIKSNFKKTCTREDHDGEIVNEWIYK